MKNRVWFAAAVAILGVALFSVPATATTWITAKPIEGEKAYRQVAGTWKFRVTSMNASITTYTVELTWQNIIGVPFGMNDAEFVFPRTSPHNVRLIRGHDVIFAEPDYAISGHDKRVVISVVKQKNTPLYGISGVIDYSNGTVLPFAILWNSTATKGKMFVGNGILKDFDEGPDAETELEETDMYHHKPVNKPAKSSTLSTGSDEDESSDDRIRQWTESDKSGQ